MVRTDNATDVYRANHDNNVSYLVSWSTDGAEESRHDVRTPFGDQLPGLADGLLGGIIEFRDPRAADSALRRNLSHALTKWFDEEIGWTNRIEALKRRASAERPVILTLRLEAIELFELPWALLRLGESEAEIGTDSRFLLRYQWRGTSTAQHDLPAAATGRVLFAHAGVGTDQDATKRERGEACVKGVIAAIEQACSSGHVDVFQRSDVLASATIAGIKQRFRQAAERRDPYTVLHILCHGLRNQETQCLQLADEALDAETLNDRLKEYAKHVRLIVISACESAATSGYRSYLRSPVQALHQSGFESVLSAHYELSYDGAAQLARSLYEGLLVHARSLEDSVRLARHELSKHAELHDWVGLRLFQRAGAHHDTRPFALRPFRGLKPFHDVHNRFFSARTPEVQELSKTLRTIAAQSQPGRLLLVSGASGVGKSSLVHAGLRPELEADEAWSVLSVAAERRPMDALADALRPAGDGASDEALYSALVDDSSAGPRLLLIDSVERMFDADASADQRERFFRLLGRLEDSPRVIITILVVRSDAVEQLRSVSLTPTQTLGEYVSDVRDPWVALSPGDEQLRELIASPARAVGLEFDDGLVEELAQAVNGEPGGLALLQYTLDLLWLERDGSNITWAAYERLNKLEGVIAAYAERTLNELTPRDREDALALLLRLVDAGETMDSCRTVAHLELVHEGLGKDSAARQRLVDTLVSARILVTDNHVIKLAHSSLLTGWATLANEINSKRRRLLCVSWLRGEAARWAEHGHPNEGVLNALELKSAREVIDLESVDEEHIDALIRVSEDHQRRQRVRRLLVIIAFALLTISLAIFALFANASQRHEALTKQNALKAKQNALDAKQRALDAEQRALLAKDKLSVYTANFELVARPEAAVSHLLSVQEHSTRDGSELSTEWKRLAWHVEQMPFSETLLEGHDADILSTRFDRDGARVAITTATGAVVLWDLKAARPTAQLPALPLSLDTGYLDGSQLVLLEPDQAGQTNTLRYTSPTGTLGDVPLKPTVEACAGRGADAPALDHPAQQIISIKHQAVRDGWLTAALSRDRSVRLVRWYNGEPQEQPALCLDADATGFAISGDGTHVAVVRDHRYVDVWRQNTADGSFPTAAIVHEHPSVVERVALDESGQRLALADEKGVVYVRSTDDAGVVVAHAGHKPPVLGIRFFAEGRKFVSAGMDRDARVWFSDVDTSPTILRSHDGLIRALDVFERGDARYLVTGAMDRTARLWSLTDPPALVLRQRDAILHAAMDSSGTRVITSSFDAPALLWHLDHETGATRRQQLAPRGGGEREHILYADFSPTDRTLALTVSRGTREGRSDGVLRLWRIPSDASRRDASVAATYNFPSAPRMARFGPRGQSVLIVPHSGADEAVGRLLEWDVEDALADSSSTPTEAIARPGSPFRFVDISSEREQLITASDTPDALQIELWPLTSEALTQTKPSKTCTLPCVRCRHHTVRFDAEGERAVSSSSRPYAYLWELDSGCEVRNFGPHDRPVRSAAFGGRDEYVVTAALDGITRVWLAADETKPPLEISDHGLRMTSVSPEAKHWVVTTGYDMTARVRRSESFAGFFSGPDATRKRLEGLLPVPGCVEARGSECPRSLTPR